MSVYKEMEILSCTLTLCLSIMFFFHIFLQSLKQPAEYDDCRCREDELRSELGVGKSVERKEKV